MAKREIHKKHSTFSTLILIFSLLQTHSSTNPDTEPLLSFKSSSDQFNKLTTWNASTTQNPCYWYGVSCLQNRVSRLVLENLGLSGSFQPLTALTQLRVLSLKQNRLSGSIPNLSNLTSLKLLFLSNNEFSGDFPASLFTLFRIYRLDLSYNNFSGQIPVDVNRLTHLLTLRLEENRFLGSISGLEFQNLQDFNVSGNKLAGEIPKSLSGFPISSFGNNQILCGSPLQRKCETNVSDPTRPGSDGAIASPLLPLNGTNSIPSSIVASSPTSIPTSSNKPGFTHNSTGRTKITPLALIAIITGDVLVLAVISLLLYCYFCRKISTSKNKETHEKIIYNSTAYSNSISGAGTGGYERGKMVFFEGVKKFELEDLLRASAEMLGKGGFGTAYKAVLEDGNVVAVKRLKDVSVGGKREFEQQMEVLGMLRHLNVVSLRAYYFARDEKLLVYDYMPNGSLFWLLHGNRGPGRTPLDWTTRLRFASGAARGLAYIHNSCKSLRLVHGNIKSTNILIDRTGNACVSDLGLTFFNSPTTATAQRMNGYRAPDQYDGRKPNQKGDVFSFGVLLLELLTGKCPSLMDNNIGPIGLENGGYGGLVDLPRWVQSVVREEWTAEVFDLELMRYKDIEEEMVGLLQIAMACTSLSPDQRPSIAHVVKMIDEIQGVEASPSSDTLDSVSDDTFRASE